VYQRVPERHARSVPLRPKIVGGRVWGRLRRSREDPEDDRGGETACGDEERDPTDQGMAEGASVSTVDARPPRGHETDDRERAEYQPEDRGARREQRDLGRVADGDRVDEVDDRADEGDHEHDAGHRNRDRANSRTRRRPGVARRRPGIAGAAPGCHRGGA